LFSFCLSPVQTDAAKITTTASAGYFNPEIQAIMLSEFKTREPVNNFRNLTGNMPKVGGH
jgi:hypothetical protein